MTTFIILSRFSTEAFTDPKEFKQLAATVSEKIKTECPGVHCSSGEAINFREVREFAEGQAKVEGQPEDLPRF